MQAILLAIQEAMLCLPSDLNSSEAWRMMLAIGWQESRFEQRRQLVTRHGQLVPEGPATGFWQFERAGGTRGVLQHNASRYWAHKLCEFRKVSPESLAVWRAFQTDDVLAAGFARLLLFTHPKRLPEVDERTKAWHYYLECWRPGQPHVNTWPDAWDFACRLTINGRPV